MKDFKIKTILGIAPNINHKKEAGIFITRGATIGLTFDLSEHGTKYILSNIEQITFVLKEVDKDPVAYNYYNTDKTVNPLFAKSTDDVITLWLTDNATKAFAVTEDDDYMGFEVTVAFKEGYNVIESQPYICVSDSLYADTI